MTRSSFVLVLAAATALAATTARAAIEPPAWDLARSHEIGAVDAIAQTPDGYLWFGGASGLHRFDGARFVRHPLPGDARVRRLLVDRSGALWIVAGGGTLAEVDERRWRLDWLVGPAGFFVLESGRLRQVPLPARLPEEGLWALAEDAHGDLWAGTVYGPAVLRRSGGLERWEGPLGSSVDDLVTSLHVGPAGSIWLGGNRGLEILRGGRVDGPRDRREVRGRVRVVLGDGRSGAVVATTAGITRYDDDTAAAVARYDNGGETNALLVDRERRLWVGRNNGIEVRDADTLVPLPGPLPPLDGSVFALTQDRDGGIWAGARGTSTTAHLTRARVRNYGTAEGLGNDAAFAILAARDGTMFVSAGLALARFQEGRASLLRPGQELPPSWRIRSLAQGADGSIWYTSADLVIRMQGKEAHAFWPAQGLPAEGTSAVAIDGRGDVWISYEHGDPVLLPGGRVDRAVRMKVGGRCVTGSLFARTGAHGDVWMAGEEGSLARARDGAVTCMSDALNLPRRRISDVLERADGTLWITSIGESGLLRARAGALVRVPSTIGMPTGSLFGLADDGRGHVWATSDVGAFRVRWDELDAVADGRTTRVVPFVANAETGMRSAECMAIFHPSVAVDARGSAWVPTQRGLAVIDAPDARGGAHARAFVEELLIDGAARPPEDLAAALAGAPVVMGPSPRHVELRFTAPDFRDAKRLSFAYRLDGFDRSWIEAGTTRSARYTGLSPGRYAFRVAVRGPASGLGPEGTIAFSVAPAVHQTWWFRGAVIAAAIAALGAGYRSRVRRLRAAFAAVEAERGRIARDLHDGLAQGFTAVRFVLDALRRALKEGPTGARDMLDQARSALDHTQAEARRAIWNIQSETMGRLPLVPRLEHVVVEARRRGGPDLRFSSAGPSPPSSAILEHELPRIVAEAVTNAQRHADARLIRVDLSTGEHGLRLAVRDDGRGLPVAGERPGGGFGILSMRERARRVGGDVHIANAEGGGVEVVVEIPADELAKLRETRPSSEQT